jgi:hypothetical protein
VSAAAVAAPLALPLRWPPDRVIAWYESRYPGESAPNRKTLYKYLGDKPESWSIGTLDALELVTAKVPRLFVLERQAMMIEVMEARIARALEREKKIQATSMRPYLDPEIRENLGLLARMYHDHFKTLQESGLEPKATQKVKVEQPAQVSHEMFHFLRPEEALRLKHVEAEVAAGRLDVLELYRTAAPIFRAEQEAADRPGPPPAVSR